MTGKRYLALALLALGAASALLAEEDAATVFAEANELFDEGNRLQGSNPQEAARLYRSAALRYEHLLGERGIRNAKLHYNLGNAYHQLDDIGRAILNYRRAERLDPSDANVQRNLAYARSRRQDRLEAAGSGRVLETLMFWHYEFAPATRMRLFAGLWLLFWTAMILRRRVREWIPREVTLALGVAAALLLGSLAYEAAGERETVAGVVIVPETVARQGDGLGYEPAFQEPLHAGAEFRVLEERRDWLRVELPDGRLCWLSAPDVELIL